MKVNRTIDAFLSTFCKSFRRKISRTFLLYPGGCELQITGNMHCRLQSVVQFRVDTCKKERRKSPCSSATVARLRAVRSGSASLQGVISVFTTLSRSVLGSIVTYPMDILVIYSGVKRLGLESNHSPASGQLKNALRYTSALLYSCLT